MTFFDSLGRLLVMGPPWEVDPKKREIKYGDNVWRTALYGIAQYFKLKKARSESKRAYNSYALMKAKKAVLSCYENGKYSRHPDHDKDDFSRDQFVMANVFLSIIGEQLLPFKWRLSKRYFSTIDLWLWYKVIDRAEFSKTWFSLYSIITKISIKLYMLRWWLFDNVWGSKNTMRPEYYAFHLMSWQFFAITEKWDINKKYSVQESLVKYLDYTNKRAKGRNGLIEMLLLRDIEHATRLNHGNISGFPFQNMLPWQNIQLKSHHEYSSAYFIALEKGNVWLADIVFNSLLKYLR